MSQPVRPQEVLARNNVRVTGRGTQPMVFVHGFGCDQNMWRFVTPAFADDHRIVLFDYVGSGKSKLAAYDAERFAQREALRRIERSQRHLLRLLDDVLNLARIEAGHVDYEIAEVPLAGLVASVTPMVEPQLASCTTPRGWGTEWGRSRARPDPVPAAAGVWPGGPPMRISARFSRTSASFHRAPARSRRGVFRAALGGLILGPTVSIYVETRIRAPLDELWRRSQEPALHERWDLRFSEISYLPRPDESLPQRFHYATRIGFGLRIRGEGESTGTRDGARGERTSALRFRSDDRKSLIREGSGYWRYVPTDDGVRFLTWYDYRTRFGVVGRVFDAVIFRPLMRWATAWSFDRLRLWLERDVPPGVSLQRAVTNAVVRVTLAFVFAWHGFVPKLLSRHPDEAAMLADAGVPARWLDEALLAIGTLELAWAVAIVALWRARWPLSATIAAMLVALVAVALRSPHHLVAPFNPVTLNLAVAALALVGWIACRDLPSAAHCLYQRPVEPRAEGPG